MTPKWKTDPKTGVKYRGTARVTKPATRKSSTGLNKVVDAQLSTSKGRSRTNTGYKRATRKK